MDCEWSNQQIEVPPGTLLVSKHFEWILLTISRHQTRVK